MSLKLKCELLFLNNIAILLDILLFLYQVVNWMRINKWPIKPIGPMIPSMFLDKRLGDDKDYGLNLFKPNSDVCMKWLDLKEPGSVVYVSFGSLATVGEEQMAELAWGLKRSNRCFLWIVRESEESKLPRDFVKETSDIGLIIKWCPQLQVLAHKSVGCSLWVELNTRGIELKSANGGNATMD